jgi:phosphate transport system protein
MTHLDIELKQLKDENLSMFELVISQLSKGRDAVIRYDKELAREINFNEKRVNALELKIDKDCENIFALFNPVAIDLRFVLACLKINSNLERIGDIADGIARYVVESGSRFDNDLLDATRFSDMFNTALTMLKDVQTAFDTDDPNLARRVFKQDDLLDEINAAANITIEKYIREHPDKIEQCLHIISMIRKLERTGDQTKNVAEEIIFFIEAKVLKHVKGKGTA